MFNDQQGMINFPTRLIVWLGISALVWVSVAPPVAAGADVAERRARVAEAAAQGVDGIPALREALSDESPLVRRAAVREMVSLGPEARDALETALEVEDPVVRRSALFALAEDATPDTVPFLARALADPDPLIRETAVHLLLEVEPFDEAVAVLLRRAAEDETPEVQRPAATALRPFRVEPRETVLLRDRPDMVDHVSRIVTLTEFPLLNETWRLRYDAGETGHTESWYAKDLDDSDWDETEIGTPWHTGYIGVAWYRTEVELPERIPHLAAELAFEGVDETAWVWVNGTYVGGQDIGPAGWNRPFRVDVTEELRWDARNRIMVRVMNTVGAGGIWKPVTLDILGFRR